jgi:hypothetical protein
VTIPVHRLRLRPPVEPPTCWAVRLAPEDLDEIATFVASRGGRLRVHADGDYAWAVDANRDMQCSGPVGADRWLLVREDRDGDGVTKFEMRDDEYVRATWEETGP